MWLYNFCKMHEKLEQCKNLKWIIGYHSICKNNAKLIMFIISEHVQCFALIPNGGQSRRIFFTHLNCMGTQHNITTTKQYILLRKICWYWIIYRDLSAHSTSKGRFSRNGCRIFNSRKKGEGWTKTRNHICIDHRSKRISLRLVLT